MRQPQFGIGATNPMSVVNNSEPVRRVDGSWAYSMPIRTISNLARDYHASVMLYIFQEIEMPYSLAFDLPSVRYLCHERADLEAQKYRSQVAKGKREGDNDAEQTDGMFGGSKIDKSIFFDLDKFAASIVPAGVLNGPVEPYLQTGRGRDDYGTASTNRMTAALVQSGKTLIPNMTRNVKPILPGQLIWMIWKMVPLRDVAVHRNPQGEVCKGPSALSSIPAHELTIDVIFYTSQDNLPPPRLTDLGKMYLEPEAQPPLECMQYKVFPDGRVNPKLFHIKDGIVFQLGAAMHREDPTATVSQSDQRTLSSYTQVEINMLKKMEIFWDLKRIYY
jgi:hypothetical protein